LRLTLGQLFALATAAVALAVGAAFLHFSGEARARILASAERQRVAEAERVEARVTSELGRASRALDALDRGIRSGAIGVESPYVVEPAMFTAVLDDARLEEVAFTRATLTGYDTQGDAVLAPEGRWQVSVLREPDGGITTRLVKREGERGPFTARLRRRGARGAFASGTLEPAGSAADPTIHPTFSVISAKSRRGLAIWSDLHWSEADQALPPPERRVVLTVQKQIEDDAGRFLGVLRVGVLTRELDQIVEDASAGDEGHRVALLVTARDEGPEGAAPKTRLAFVARLAPEDRVEEIGDDLRVVPARVPPEIAALLASPLAARLDPDVPRGEGTLRVGGAAPWLVTLRAIELGRGGTSGWLVAILVPEASYTRELVAFERMMLVAAGITLAVVLLIGALALGAVRRGLSRVVATTAKMRAFDFSPAPGARSPLRDVDDVMTGLERAKTAVRAMGKYIPIDLVRRLYETNEEPRLGGELSDVSLMFTDIEGFTSLSERLPPDELARCLGAYLEAMTVAIEQTGGTIDKYIGDAVMALWNAPVPTDDHPKRACRAALACMRAAAKLYASDAWAAPRSPGSSEPGDGAPSRLPALVTRFGLHRASVMVGHFGAPTRLSYTALGDGVNLAARLEPLCKQYGVVILASEAIVTSAKDELVFRRIDRVAVKGKTEGIDVYELLCELRDADGEAERAKIQVARRYEEAFDAYLARRFGEAAELLAPLAPSDPPSAVLLARCEALGAAPPPASWTGIHVASSK
jgi:adenylate cyclase